MDPPRWTGSPIGGGGRARAEPWARRYVSLVEHLLDRLLEGSRHLGALAQLALALGGLLGQDVTGLRVVAKHLTRGADLEALGSAAMGFLLGQWMTPLVVMPGFAAARGQMRGARFLPIDAKPSWPRVGCTGREDLVGASGLEPLTSTV